MKTPIPTLTTAILMRSSAMLSGFTSVSSSFCDIEVLQASRGITVSYESIRQWTPKFDQTYANPLKRKRPKRSLFGVRRPSPKINHKLTALPYPLLFDGLDSLTVRIRIPPARQKHINGKFLRIKCHFGRRPQLFLKTIGIC